MSTILITGGTGLVGSALTNTLLQHGHEVIILSRTPKTSSQKNLGYAQWDVNAQTIDADAVKNADYIIHLAGAGVADKRWTEERKKEIRDSRTQSSKLLIDSLTNTPNKVKAIVSASAIGWYGDDDHSKNTKAFTEDAPANDDFLGETCRLWEASVDPVKSLGIRVVKFRIGIVLSKDGGALAEFMRPIKFGVAGVIGSGKQIVSWIHLEDLCRMFMLAVENESLSGVYNAVAPAPVSNKQLTLALAQRMKGSFYVPLHVPAFALKLFLGGMSVEVLKSATVSSGKIHAAGFTFLYPTIETALHNLFD